MYYKVGIQNPSKILFTLLIDIWIYFEQFRHYRHYRVIRKISDAQRNRNVILLN